jgi:integrase/recombinase XerD
LKGGWLEHQLLPTPDCTRNCIMTGLRFLLRVTLRRLDLAVGIYHIREPQKDTQLNAQRCVKRRWRADPTRERRVCKSRWQKAQ